MVYKIKNNNYMSYLSWLSLCLFLFFLW